MDDEYVAYRKAKPLTKLSFGAALFAEKRKSIRVGCAGHAGLALSPGQAMTGFWHDSQCRGLATVLSYAWTARTRHTHAWVLHA